MKKSASRVVLVATACLLPAGGASFAGGLTPDGRAGVVTAIQGTSVVRPVGRERWTPLDARSLLFPGDVLRTDARGANALEVRLAGGARLVVGPGAVLEFPEGDGGGVRLLRGDLEAKAPEKGALRVAGTGGYAKDVAATAWLRATDRETKELPEAPKWLQGYRSSTSEEWMGSLLAKVDGKDVPLTVGYHKVTVEIRDQIARTTVEESFRNSTSSVLEGVFSFPLPADASISGFGMWIGDELVEADLVEKERAREIYEDILRRKKDPGLLEWEGGNLFKARVYPIPGNGEKRIRLRYTQVLPLEGEAYRYRYALRSELLRLNPLRELSIAVNVVSAAAIRDVSSPTHPVTLRKTDHEAVVEFGAQEYAPDRDFEVAVTVGRGDGLSALAHRRGDDGFFMLLLSPPDPATAGWQRDLVPEGDPLDLVLVADTSGSMDPASRGAQAAFLSALLAQLSAKDRFRLLACDVEPRFLLGEDALPASEENAARALAALDARFSLGWTDLDHAFDAVLAKAGPTTHVVYVGDGIPTARDGNAVATADRVRTKAKDSKATFHAVSTSASYEKVVLEGIAAMGAGGGSVRRGEESPAAAAKALLGEVARPGLRNLKVEVQGIPTAKVYPEVLPNVPLGEQQVVLGRFLPGGDAKTASVVVTGTLAGKPVRYASSFAVPAAEEGNSFLPRLWARRHLDALLAQGQDARTKEEVVAFSREYQIMTPYTSFLVLESDEDRARYGVERTVKMRDAERFFAEARDKAALEIARRQMEAARRWRLDLRRKMLREIEGLGRDLPVPAAYGWMDRDGDGVANRLSTADWGSTAPGVLLEAESVALTPAVYELREYARSEARDTGVDFSEVPFEGPMTPVASPAAAMPPPPTSPAEPGMGGEEAGDDAVSDPENPLFGAEPEEESAAKSVGFVARRALARGDGYEFQDLDGVTNGLEDDFRGRTEGGYRRGPWPRPPFSMADLGFPGIEQPPKLPRAVADPAWDPVVLQALRALDRRPALAALVGGIRVVSEGQRLHPLQGRVEGQWRATAIVAARRWHAASDGTTQAPFETWLSETERGVLNAGLRLGRNRPAADADRTRWPLPLADRSIEDVLRSFALSFRRAPKVARGSGANDENVVTIVFAANDDPANERVLVVDLGRSVLLEERSVLDGKTTGATRYADFVEVAGRWWATKVESLDEDGHVVARQTLKVEAIDAAAFDAAFDDAMVAHGDVVFLVGEDPKVADARQAVRDGRAGLAQHLVVALSHAARQRWDDAWKAFEAAATAAGEKPGTTWMRLALLARSRRGTDFGALARKTADAIARDLSPEAAWRAWVLDRGTSGLGGAERLAIVDSVRPVWDREGPYRELWALHALRRHAEASDRAGLRRAARMERADLAAKRPFDVTAVISHAVDLANGEDAAAAAAYVGERATKEGPWGRWTRQETDDLFQAWSGWLWGLGDLPGLEAAANAWVATAPRHSTPQQMRASLLYFRGRPADADRWVVEQLNADVATLADPAARAAREAAIQVALGHGWNFWAQSVPAEWRGPMADLALRLMRADARWADLASSILNDWRFRQTEEARLLARTLRADVTAEGAVASMPLPRLARYVRTVEWGANQVEDATWRRVLDALAARWRATTEFADAELLGQLVLTVADARNATADRLAHLRERLAKAGELDARAAAQALFDACLTSPHDTTREDEAFSLLPRLLDPRDEDAVNRARSASAARTLATWVHEARLVAAQGAPEERAKRTRAEAARHAREARTKARAETSARFATAVAAAAAPLRAWLDVERLGYLVESQADLGKAEGEARELLDGLPASADESEERETDRLLAKRAAVVLAYAATRRGAPAGLADRVLAYLRTRLAAGDRVPIVDARYEVFRLLVALDRAEDLEKDILAWIRPDEADPTWRVALAYLQAETNRVREAATTMEGAAALSVLGAAQWAALADWYLVLKEDARRNEALDRRYDALPTWQLEQVLWQERQKVDRSGEGVPAELDPETLRVLRILLGKSENPGNELSHVVSLYRPTKDFRLLESLADGVVGHSPEAVYAYVQQATQVVQEIHEEATCDALAARLSATLADGKRSVPLRDVDRRGLRLLLASVESRAGAVPKADPAHGERALAAMRAAFEGALVPGEAALLAGYLSSLGAPADPGIGAEQMARLEVLLAGAGGGALERLAIGRHLAQVLWVRNRRDEATDRLESLLAEVRAASEGTLLPEAREPYDALVNWWAELGRHRKAEARLRADLEAEPRSGRRERLRMRLFALYVQALERGTETTLGAKGDLFRAAATEMERYLMEGPAHHLGEAAGSHASLHVVASKTRAARDAGAEYEAFFRERLPEALSRRPFDGIDVLQNLVGRLEEVRGPLAPLSVVLDRVEREPSWHARIGQDAWSRLAGWMAEWRRKAGGVGALEPRLLALVLARLERSLTTMSGDGAAFWHRGYGSFWGEHARDFAAVAARVAELRSAEIAVVLHVARYQRDGLGLNREAVATLQAAIARGNAPEDLRATCATWLREDARYAECWALAEALVAERADNLAYRVLGAAALHGLARDKEALALLEATAARWKERKAWDAGVASTLAVAALEARLAAPAAAWRAAAARMRREAGGGAGPDSTLSSWYGTLARARSLLGETDAAVRAAAAAVVAWGRDRDNRARALETLRDVIAQAKDFDAWLSRYEAEVAASGLDAPTIRKAAGQVLEKRGRFDRAAAQYRAARDLDPADAEVHALLVHALDAQGDGPGALEALLASLRMAPKNLPAYPDLAQRFAKANDSEAAERARTNLVEAMPSEPDGHRELAKLREAAGRFDLAAGQWLRVTEVRPLEPEGWLSLARTRIEAGDGAGARAAIDHLLGATWDARFGDVKAEAAKLRARLP